MIVNLTQHRATPEQLAAGVVDLPEPKRKALVRALTIETLPSKAELEDLAWHIASLSFTDADYMDTNVRPQAAMIGGAPYLMAPLVKALQNEGIKALYAFSQRESVESHQPDGTVVKTNVFKHVGFVEA
ncbi:hypothetical protein [Diaphorobacter sp. J5-51]|uniref:hypothetical protein n=1 Tax=Diaphorobacter sp. J5-51 TaxID=680496 RepID=UPI00064326C2|nr:hypothetical protein [Diaphorobacter sp. J5-51]KLR59472.1 hypothetical protein OX89_01555 [Diaphorobacter sp. J5-51]